MPTLSEKDHLTLLHIRNAASRLVENTSALYWDAPFEGMLLRRLREDMAALNGIFESEAYKAVFSDAAARGVAYTRHSWNGEAVTSHVEAV
jgi:hypothetical protein